MAEGERGGRPPPSARGDGCLSIQRPPGMKRSSTKPASLEITSWWGRLLVGRRPRRTLVRLAVLAVGSYVVFGFVLIPIRVAGRSMEPTYRNGRITAINRLAYRTAGPKRGDIVGLRTTGSRLILLKRIVGLPGERVSLQDGRVLVNGQPLDEPYVRDAGLMASSGAVLLGAEEYFAIGDNREVTAYGAVKRSEIQGRVPF